MMRLGAKLLFLIGSTSDKEFEECGNILSKRISVSLIHFRISDITVDICRNKKKGQVFTPLLSFIKGDIHELSSSMLRTLQKQVDDIRNRKVRRKIQNHCQLPMKILQFFITITWRKEDPVKQNGLIPN